MVEQNFWQPYVLRYSGIYFRYIETGQPSDVFSRNKIFNKKRIIVIESFERFHKNLGVGFQKEQSTEIRQLQLDAEGEW